MTRRDGTSWLSGSDERVVQEKVAAAYPDLPTDSLVLAGDA